jgi:DNA-binding NarL/FixJ family response regulator
MSEIKTRVVVVDDHEVDRAGITSLLSKDPAFEVVGGFRSAEELLDQLLALTPDVIITEHLLPGISGAAVCGEIIRRRPAIAVLMLTSVAEDAVVHACIAAGARGYVLKGASGSDLVDAVHAVARGESVLAPEVVGRVIEWARQSKTIYNGGESLLPHEIVTLALVAEGLKNREIARKLNVSEPTVKHYLRSTIRKLGARERSEAVATGIRRGVI